jgi:carboxyl-terminal processing protease
MISVDRRAFGSMVLALLGTRALPVSAQTPPATRLYVGNAARLTVQIPSDWTVGTSTIGSVATFDYEGAAGFVVSLPLIGPTLDEAAAFLAASPRFAGSEATVTTTTWSGGPARRVDGRIEGASASALVVPHPSPFDLFEERMAYAALVTDVDSFARISETLSFTPDRVSPEDFVTSVIELVEARAYWSAGVDWDAAREQARIDIDGLTDVSLTQGAIANIVGHLTGVGDNHSFVRSPSQAAAQGQGAGVGLLIGGRRVMLVYPDGPADRAGVRAGDVIEAVDHSPFYPPPGSSDPSALMGFEAELTLRRAGLTDTITVTVEQGPYSQYLAPTGRRLAGDLGYIQLPGAIAPGRNADYVAAARAVITAIDQRPSRGWVIDLRLDTGGSYSPMIAGIGPILGNGRFFGWVWADGREGWVTYTDGRILGSGQDVPDYSGEAPVPHELARLPVAVLTSPQTRSAGEVTTLAFVGRTGARRFGETTSGKTTGTVTHFLFDGTTLALAEVAMMDRLGATHLSGVEPDEPVPIDWESYGIDDDPVLQSAIAWLNQQPAPGDATPALESVLRD